MRERQIDLYEHPAIYELLHAPGTAAEVSVLQKIDERYGSRRRSRARRWLEPACGTGRYLARARRRGIATCGFDASPAMVRYARARELDVRLASLEDFAGRLGQRRFDYVFLTINTVRHLPDDASLLTHFEETVRVLGDGGLYVVGLHLSAYGRESVQTDRWTGARGGLAVFQTIRYVPPRSSSERIERVRSRIRTVRPSGEEHLRNGYDLRCYDCAEWESVLTRSPFRVRAHVDEQGREASPRDGAYGLWILELQDPGAMPSRASRR